MEDKLYSQHVPVLLNECLELLSPQNLNGPIKYLDGTFGGGGHCQAFLSEYPTLEALGLDQDREAIKNAEKLIESKNLSSRLKVIHTNFENFFYSNDRKNLFDIILADIGVSSHQFDTDHRGFSFQKDAPLDMRMDKGRELTSHKIINTYSQEELEEIFFKFGEEKFSKTIVKNIIEARSNESIETTKELENICFHSYPKRFRFGKTHPATRVFQALRIAVNDELGVLERSIPKMIDSLNEGGKLGIISFHSLEDRIVKHEFKKVYQSNRDKFKILTKKPITASDDEIDKNPRSRSAKLRVIQKLMLD